MATTNTEPPAVLEWYSKYCRFAAALFAAASLVGVYIARQNEQLAVSADLEPMALILLGVLWTLTMLFLAFVHVAAFQTRQREPWAWALHAVVISIGLTTLILWPLTFPLLAKWLKPDTQRWFGREPFQDRNKASE